MSGLGVEDARLVTMALFGLLMAMMATSSTTAPAVVADALDRDPATPWEWLRPDPEARGIKEGRSSRSAVIRHVVEE